MSGFLAVPVHVSDGLAFRDVFGSTQAAGKAPVKSEAGYPVGRSRG